MIMTFTRKIKMLVSKYDTNESCLTAASALMYSES